MREGFARVEGTIKALAEEVRAANLARAAENVELRKDVDDHEHRMRTLEDRMAKQEARPMITPKGAWGVAATVLGLVIAAVALFA